MLIEVKNLDKPSTIPYLCNRQSTLSIHTPQTMNTDTLPRYRAIHVEFFGPTNTKGARVRVKDLRQGKTKFLPYDYAVGDIVEQASDYLTSCGIQTDGLALHDTQRGYTLLTSNFDKELTHTL